MADKDHPAAAAAELPLTPAPPMSTGYKIARVQEAIHMISTSGDDDSTLRIRALDKLIAYCEAEKARISKEMTDDADAALS